MINLMTEKIVGYGMLTGGLLTIILAGLNVFGVFTGRIQPVTLFRFQGISIDSSQLVNQTYNLDTEGLPPEQVALLEQIFDQQKAAPPQKIEILPAEILNQTSNVFGHLILMGFIASIGYKVAGLGVLMIRPIVVKLKEDKVPTQVALK